MRCTACLANADASFEHVVLRKHKIRYWLCPQCGLLFTETPFWLEEAYESAISPADTGVLSRNLGIRTQLISLLFAFLPHDGRFLDFAGGYGILTRLMRDEGFDFYWSDRYCENLFARGFEAEAAEGPFDAVTAIEVLEHTHEPLPLLTRLSAMSDSGTVIFTTRLYGDEPPAPSWPYYEFDAGQHISFYQLRTLERLGSSLGLRLLSSRGIHMFTRRTIGRAAFSLVLGRACGLIGSVARSRMRSKILSDHDAVIQSNSDRAAG